MGNFILEFQIDDVKAAIALSVLSKNRIEVGLPLKIYTEKFIHSRREKNKIMSKADEPGSICNGSQTLEGEGQRIYFKEEGSRTDNETQQYEIQLYC